jgi:hypothetical protein
MLKLKVDTGREPGPSLTVKELHALVRSEEMQGRLFVDNSGDYFLPADAPSGGGVEGVLLSPEPQVVFTYHYGKNSEQTFREVHDPLKIVLSFNEPSSDY